MANNVFDIQVHRLIHDGLANTQQSICSTLNAEDRTVDNALRRLKSAEKIKFVKEAKRWTSLSQPSALPAEGVEGSGDTNPPAATSAAEGNNMKEPQSNSSSVSDIDDAINKAKAGKGQKPAKEEASAKGKRPRLSDEERKARDEQRELDRAAKKQERERVKAEKAAARDKDRPAAHMSKVQKAAAKLPNLSDVAQSLFNDATVNLDVAGVAALAAHLQHFNRTKATERALNQKVNVDDMVKITGGEPRFIGLEGQVTKAQRIRCYVKVEGFKKPVYLFTSDVEVTKAAKVAAVG